LFKAIGRNEEMEDREFDMMFPKAIQAESEFHFTPIKIAKLAAEYLADSKETKILDIGSGAGKFCMIGSVCTDAFFVGVEQRIHLNSLATQISRKYELTNLYTPTSLPFLSPISMPSIFSIHFMSKSIYPAEWMTVRHGVKNFTKNIPFM
jgi:hypothetical protein